MKKKQLAKAAVELFAAAAAFRDNRLDQEQQGCQSEENLVAVLVIFHAVAALVLLFERRDFGQDLLQLELARACVKVERPRHVRDFLQRPFFKTGRHDVGMYHKLCQQVQPSCQCRPRNSWC